MVQKASPGFSGTTWAAEKIMVANLTSAYEQDRVGFLDLKIYHYGYMNSQVDNKQKFNRNVNLLLQELKDEKEAFLAYIKALMLANNFTPAREALDKLINTYPALANHAKHLKPEFKRLLSSETIYNGGIYQNTIHLINVTLSLIKNLNS